MAKKMKPTEVPDAKKIAANERAKARRAKVKELKERRATAMDMAAIGALQSDQAKINEAIDLVAVIDAEEAALSKRPPMWEEMPDGRWTRTIILEKFKIVAMVEVMNSDPSGWTTGTAMLKDGEMDLVVCQTFAPASELNAVEVLKTRLNHMIAGLRKIARS